MTWTKEDSVDCDWAAVQESTACVAPVSETEEPLEQRFSCGWLDKGVGSAAYENPMTLITNPSNPFLAIVTVANTGTFPSAPFYGRVLTLETDEGTIYLTGWIVDEPIDSGGLYVFNVVIDSHSEFLTLSTQVTTVKFGDYDASVPFPTSYFRVNPTGTDPILATVTGRVDLNDGGFFIKDDASTNFITTYSAMFADTETLYFAHFYTAGGTFLAITTLGQDLRDPVDSGEDIFYFNTDYDTVGLYFYNTPLIDEGTYTVKFTEICIPSQITYVP